MHKQPIVMYNQVQVIIRQLLHPLKKHDTVELTHWDHSDVQ